MEPDNFDLHIYSNNVSYYHKDLIKLIDSVTEKDKSELEKLATEVSKKLVREVKLIFGYKLRDRYINNILGHVLSGDRQDFDLNPIDLDQGYLKYHEHNIGSNDDIKAALYSVLLKYISILNKHAIKKL